MKSNSQTPFGNSSRFKSIPDGRRVFLVSFPWTGYYLIPDSSTERQLHKKIPWEYLLVYTSLFVLAGLLWYFRNSVGMYGAILFPILFFIVSGIFRWVLYRNELDGLLKIDFPSAYSTSYSELQKNLRSHSKNSFPNYEISTLLDIPDSQEKIIMLKYTKPFPNVLRCRLDGSIVWRAELPPNANDVYTNLEWRGQKLHAFSRSCRSVLLDENTGRVLSADAAVEQNSA